ncbi:MAG: hypothetical protein K0S79_77 [Nitrospira sp.]|nr:hypothetical protein [Nitrospira sp.]
MAIRAKFGAGWKFDRGVKYGYGSSEPWSPLGSPSTVARFTDATAADVSTAPASEVGADVSPSFSAETGSDVVPTYSPEDP